MGDEGSKVRLVRCPKCENLLPELPDYSVYQCGGCGAVLRGTKKTPASDGLLEKSDGERGSGGSDKERVDVDIDVSETESGSDGVGQHRKDRVFPERSVSSNVSSSRTENKEVLFDSDRSRGGEMIGSRSDQSCQVGVLDNKYRRTVRVPYGNQVRGNDFDSNMDDPEFVKLGADAANELEEIRHPFGSLRSRPVMDQWGMERNGSVAFCGNARDMAEHRRYATFPYSDEGPSDHPPSSLCSYGEQVGTRDGLVGLTAVESLENDRVEILRKLDELKDQLSRSCNMAGKQTERVAGEKRMAPPPPDTRGGRGTFMPEGSTSLYNSDMQPPSRDKHFPKPPYFSCNKGPLPYFSEEKLHPPPRNVLYEFPRYEDAYLPQMFARPYLQLPHEYLLPICHDRFPGHYMDFNHDSLPSHPHETLFHQPACSCLGCYSKNWQIPKKVSHPVFSSRRSPHDHTNSIFYHHMDPVSYVPSGYASTGSDIRKLHYKNRRPLMRSSSDIDTDNGGFRHHRPRRVVVARGNGQVCHPIAGGAPFIACCYCFQLLKLPRKFMGMSKNQKTIRCGACSASISFEIEDKNIVVSAPAEVGQFSVDVGSSDEMFNKSTQSPHGFLEDAVMNSCSDNFDNYDYRFQLTDTETTEHNLLSNEQMSHRQELHFSSSSFSEDELSPDSVIVRRDASGSAEFPSEDNVSLPLPESPLKEHYDISSSNYSLSRNGKGSKSNRTVQEKVIIDRTTSQQNSVKDVAVATEMEVSSNEYLNTGESMEVSKEEERPRANKGSESFFAGLIRKSFRGSRQSIENGRSNVSINGQLIPDRVVKKAETLAGPIQPGEYWYDFRAGFWGVMGQPCLGIIPPFIEEFNYTMPVNCGAGNTKVLVNGRELHQSDLDLLAGRGLPMMSDKSYLIEVSGKVLDEETGEELDCLGKLAPTVERSKRGFGMKPPRVVA